MTKKKYEPGSVATTDLTKLPTALSSSTCTDWIDPAVNLGLLSLPSNMLIVMVADEERAFAEDALSSSCTSAEKIFC